jgi:hypothetical protein
MRELQWGFDTAQTRELPSQATTRREDATAAGTARSVAGASTGAGASVSQLSNALAVRQQELDASRTRELELVASQPQVWEALQTARSAWQTSQTRLQRLHDEMDATRHAADGTMTRLQQDLESSRAQLYEAIHARARQQEVDELRRLMREVQSSKGEKGETKRNDAADVDHTWYNWQDEYHSLVASRAVSMSATRCVSYRQVIHYQHTAGRYLFRHAHRHAQRHTLIT